MRGGTELGWGTGMELKLDARMRRLVARLPVVNVYSAIEIALLAGLGVQVARLAWALATPVGPLGDWRPAGPVVPGLPGEAIAAFDPFFRLAAPAAGPGVVTSLQLTLFGTRTDDATGRGGAIIAGPDGVQRSISVGEEIQPGVKLVGVAFDHVVIDRGGATEDLFLDQSSSVTPVAPSGSTPGAATPGLPPQTGAGVSAANIRQEIGFIPRIDAGRISGLVVRPQGSGAAFRTAGLRDGDVVTSIGGRPVGGPQDLDRVAADFKAGGNLPLTVERGRETRLFPPC
jgi:general secretion pathway protein C